MPTNLEYKAREKERKRERRRRPEELNEKKGDKDPEREIKKGEIFLLKEQHENFVAAVRNASGHQSNAR